MRCYDTRETGRTPAFPMPIHCKLDDANERVHITSTGEVSVDEVLEAVNWQAEHGAWSYGVLYDARDTISGPRAEDLFRLVTRVGALTAAHGPRGPVAFVLTAYHPLRTVGSQYSGLGELTAMNFKVFTDLDAAQRWLEQERGL